MDFATVSYYGCAFHRGPGKQGSPKGMLPGWQKQQALTKLQTSHLEFYQQQ